MKKEYLVQLLAKSPRVKNLKGEHAICYEFADRLRRYTLNNIFNVVWMHVPNEFAGGFKPVWGQLMTAIGRIKGAPDYLFLWAGGSGCIEFKDVNGTQSEDQEYVEQWCQDAGVPYEVAFSADQGFDILVSWGLLPENHNL